MLRVARYLIAFLGIAGIAWAVNGIEVLSEVETQNGIEVLSVCEGAAKLEARIVVDGVWIVVDCAEADRATLVFPDLVAGEAMLVALDASGAEIDAVTWADGWAR